MHEIKGWFFLALSLLFLMTICAIAAMGMIMRPVRWGSRSYRPAA